MSYTLSVLDQSPVVGSMQPSEAITNTMGLVVATEGWGYHRYWFAEHHNTASFASASPPTMIANAAARTTKIRLGSGGMLMSHARPLEIAETFRSLAAMAPGRIDLGMGRAPGGDQRVMDALAFSPQKATVHMDETMSLLKRETDPVKAGELVAVPSGDLDVEPWVLGTSMDSAKYAADHGLPYAFGSFIDPTQMNEALSTYHQHFTPSPYLDAPQTLIALVVFCADTEAKAQEISQCSEKWFVRSFLRGENVRFPQANETVTPSPQEQLISMMRRQTVVIGDQRSCKQQLEELSKLTATTEFSVVTITEHQEDRLRSYELLAS